MYRSAADVSHPGTLHFSIPAIPQTASHESESVHAKQTAYVD